MMNKKERQLVLLFCRKKIEGHVIDGRIHLTLL